MTFDSFKNIRSVYSVEYGLAARCWRAGEKDSNLFGYAEMRLVFVNHAHPDVKHVSGLRLSRFAMAMARRGHQVVLITSTLKGDTGPVDSPSAQLERLSGHDWSIPFHIQVQPHSNRVVSTIRAGNVVSPIRRMLTLWTLVYHGGVFEDWVAAVRPHVGPLIDRFRPDLVWGTFGNTSNLVLAQYVARQAGCPWAIDIKDNWITFVRPSLRKVMTWRFRDAQGYTANSHEYLTNALRWFPKRVSRVVYSGVADDFSRPASRVGDPATADLVLVGSLREEASLQRFLIGVKAWLQAGLPERTSRFRLVYVGLEGKRLCELLEQIQLYCSVHSPGYLSAGELARYSQHSLANCYIWMRGGFHHKLLELLACGRPVIAFPGEMQESLQLAEQCATPFAACADERALHAALDQAWDSYDSGTLGKLVTRWSWESMAVDLDQAFSGLARRE